MKRISSIILGAAFALFGTTAMAQGSCDCDPTTSLVTNGDFSAGNTGFTSSLPFNMTCFAQSYGVGAEARDKCNNGFWADDLWDHTVGNSTGSYMIVDGWNNAGTNMIWTNGATVNVVAGQEYTFSFWQVRGISSAFASQTLQMRVGATVISTVNTAGAGQLIWTEYCATWTATFTGATTISIWQPGPVVGNQDYGIDDIYFGTCSSECLVEANLNAKVSLDGCTWGFSANATPGPGTTVVGYSWTFGDGYSSTDANPTHTYQGSGVYVVCVTVYAVNELGECCQTTICKQIQVECEPKDCEAVIEEIILSSPANPEGNCEVIVEAVVSFVNRPVVGYFWNFGDGTTGTSSGSSTLHNFPGPGIYNVCVTIILASSPDECCSFTFCQEVEVFCPDVKGRAANDNVIEVIESSFNDQDVRTNDDLGLFPNPGNEQLNVVLNIDEASNSQVSVMNIEGKEVMNESIMLGGGNMKTLDVTQLPAGIYVIQVRTESGFYTQNWIKR